MRGRKGQLSIQDLLEYYERQQSSEHFEEELCFFRRKKKTASGLPVQREDEGPQNDRLGPGFVMEIATIRPNEPDLRSVHCSLIPLTKSKFRFVKSKPSTNSRDSYATRDDKHSLPANSELSSKIQPSQTN